MEREIERFDVQKKDGTLLTLVTYQEFIEATAVGDTGRRWIPGLKRTELLADGSPVNYIDENTFKIVTTDDIVRKV